MRHMESHCPSGKSRIQQRTRHLTLRHCHSIHGSDQRPGPHLPLFTPRLHPFDQKLRHTTRHM